MSDIQFSGLERLEDRTLLAVNVSQNGANLVITGDNFDNAVTLHEHPDGSVHVFVDEDGDGTSDFDGYYYGVENIKITLKGGDDEIFIGYDYYGLHLEKNLTIDTGTGDDLVVISEFDSSHEVDGNIVIKTGDGDDNVVIAGFDVNGDLTIDTGNGEDYVAIGDEGYYYSEIYDGGDNVEGEVDVDGNTVINTGNHDDDIDLQPADDSDEIEFDGNVTINTGAGNDRVDIGDDADEDLHFHGNFSLQLGAGDDYVDIENDEYETRFYGKVIINGAGGFDQIDGIDEWFNDADATFEDGVGAVKFVKIEVFS